jgi:hypothetical protein
MLTLRVRNKAPMAGKKMKLDMGEKVAANVIKKRVSRFWSIVKIEHGRSFLTLCLVGIWGPIASIC